MLIEQIIEVDLGGLGPLVVRVLLQLVIFLTKQKTFKVNLQVEYHFLLKYCTRQCTLLPPTWAQSLAKFNTKMQDF